MERGRACQVDSLLPVAVLDVALGLASANSTLLYSHVCSKYILYVFVCDTYVDVIEICTMHRHGEFIGICRHVCMQACGRMQMHTMNMVQDVVHVCMV